MGTRPFDVVGLGQSSLDHVGEVAGAPTFTGKEALLAYHCLPGGQVATALLAAARLGLRAAFLGSVGDDAAAAAILGPLRAAGVDLTGVRVRSATPSQLAMIVVDRKSGERTVLWYRDARLCLKPGELRREEIVGGRVLHLDAGDVDVSIWAARLAREAGIPVVLDADTPAPGIDALLATVDFPIVSREFAEHHFGSAREALAGLLALGAQWAVVTLGRRGALARTREREIRSPAFAVDAVDTTGAGDAFHGAVVWTLLEGLPAEQALRVANAVAALNCQALGAQGGLPTREELERFLARHQPGAWQGSGSEDGGRAGR